MPPPPACDRRKNPERLRASLIETTMRLIAEGGLGSLTVEGVAKAAGVTKGGLFHHFASKQALIDGVVDAMLVQADAMIDTAMAADPEPHGSFTRAYLHGTIAGPTLDGGVPARGLCLAMLADPNQQRRWADWQAARVLRHAATDDTLPCALVRHAADGIWLSSLHTPEGESLIGDDVRRALDAMTRPGP